jgi:hypothetical protein
MTDRNPHIARDLIKIERQTLNAEPARIALNMKPAMMLGETVQDRQLQAPTGLASRMRTDGIRYTARWG